MELDVVGLISALAAAVLASAGKRGSGAVALALAFAVTSLAVTPSRFPPAAAIGALVAGVAAAALARPRWSWLPPIGAGAVAGLWVPLLVSEGLPFAGALALAALSPALGVYFSARAPDFAPPVVREEALLLTGGLGLLLALGSEVAAGWKSAAALSAAPIAPEDVPRGIVLPAFVAGCVLLGALYSMWKRKRR